MQQATENQHLIDDANHYTTHLSEVNNTQEVIATEDIVNQQGMTLVKKGSRINKTVAQRILQHKLLKPIETQVKLENTLTEQDLLKQFSQLFEKYADIATINAAHKFGPVFSEVIRDVTINEILYQKLTVLSERLPDVFEKALFCAWLCALIAREMPMQRKDIHNAFIAGLFHDIGLLHIDPLTLEKKGVLTPQEWRAIQSHVVIGYLIFKESDVANLEVAQAIIEHHECCDGTGYPQAKSAEQLCPLGQVLGLADSLQAIRINRFKSSGRNLRDALPLLHMNSNKHFIEIYKTMCLIILNSNLPVYADNPYPDFPALISTLCERVQKLDEAILVLMLIRYLTETDRVTENYKKYARIIDPVIFMIKSSGIVRTELMEWLSTLSSAEDSMTMRDLNEYDLMQTELLWQLRNLLRNINAYILEAKLQASLLEHLQKLADYLQNALVSN
jgi:HD-GYP domain-containing protein (c-di-GMP phosphodiesterase class II)